MTNILFDLIHRISRHLLYRLSINKEKMKRSTTTDLFLLQNSKYVKKSSEFNKVRRIEFVFAL